MSHVFPRLMRGSITTTLALFALALLATSLHAAPQIVTVDSGGSVGQYTSIALNASGQPVVSYYDQSNFDMKLATCTANCASASPTWQIVTVDSGGNVGLYTSLALNTNGQPVVSYHDFTNGNLKLATCTADCASASPTWQIVTVDSGDFVGQFTSLALNASGQPVVSYFDVTNTALKLATCTANCASASPTWQLLTVDSGGAVGAYTSLALNASGQPVVSYYDSTNDDLKLATCTANCASASPTWQIVTVDSGGNVGQDTSLALNTSGQPVVSYYDQTNRDLKLATCTANCATASPTWQLVTVDSSGVLGLYTSLALNTSGQPVVSYYDFTNFDLKLATCTANCATASPTWQIVTVDSGGSVGEFTSLALNTSGQPVISYYDLTNANLKLATVLADFTVTASPNPASAGGLLTCAPTSGGTQAATATINDGQTASCVATPNAGYTTQSISGCSGTATGVGVNSYTTGAVTANCTVTATFAPTTVGVCGSANGVGALVAPTANLCSTGTASAVTTAAGSFAWTCSGSVAAITTDDASCSAPQQFTITTSPGVGGNLSCTPNPINSGATSTCTATPLSGYTTQSISGCSGTATGVGVNSYTTGAVTANCAVTASFALTTVGVCGSANGVASLVAPTANLCSTGTASAVSAAGGNFNWTCSGSVATITTDDASCTAPQQFTITSSPGVGGNLSCTPNPINSGSVSTCTATPLAGYSTQTIAGCSGTATGVGVNSYTTGAVTANCTVTATFAPTTVGTCGSANGVATLLAPTANLCASGTASVVTAAAGMFNWTCNGSVAAIAGEDASCSAPQQFTITTSPGVGGSLSCTPNPINSGSVSTCTATPLAGYTTQSVSGCSGTATGVGINSYTTGAVTANCTVTATFAPTTVGSCGSANGVATLVAPTANLCASGTASAVSAAGSSFNWSCSGSVAAITTDDASCSSAQQFTITTSTGGGGSLSCAPNPINSGSVSTCTATPLAGYTTQSVSGCSGTATGVGVNSYTTGAVTANCTVTATFAPTTVGSCGSANGVATLVAPTANLCASGTASAVSAAGSSFNWSCSGSVAAITTEDASCSATQQFSIAPSRIGAGDLTCTASTVNAGSTVICTATPFVGFFTQSISGCGGTATGPGVNTFTTGAVNARCTVTASFAALPPAVVPTLNQWMLLLLALLVLGVAARRSRAM